MSRRALKIAEAIREVVSMAILVEIKDPRVQGVTVTHAEVSGDLQFAKIHVSIMGDDTQQHLCLRGLQSAAGFLQSKVARRIETRYTPRIEFVLDMGVKKSIEVARLLREVLPSEGPAADGAGEENADVAEHETEKATTGEPEAPHASSEPTSEEPKPSSLRGASPNDQP